MTDRRRHIETLAARLGGRVLAQGASLGSWMARSRVAVTALGTTLYELAYLRTPAWILANYPADREALDWYAANGPHRAIGVAGEVGDDRLREALAELSLSGHVAPPVVGLGGGAARLALLLFGRRLIGRDVA